MSYKTIALCLLLISSSLTFGQKEKPLQSGKVVVIAQQNELADRYSLEIALVELLNQYNIKTKISLNIIKEGENPKVLLEDSLTTLLSEEGFDTYLLVSVRGYDKKFKQSSQIKPFEEEINAGHLFSLYRDGISNVSFTFTFYKNKEPFYSELIRTGSVGSRTAVMEKLMKKVKKSLVNNWL